MRAVLFVVVSLICLNAVQANRISKSESTSTQRSKHTLQRSTVPKLSAVTSQFNEDFTIRVTFANCMKESTLKVSDFSFDEKFVTSSLQLKTIVNGIQFELTGKAKPRKDTVTQFDVTGTPYTVGINANAITFNSIVSDQGVASAQAQTTLSWVQAEDFRSITSVISKSAESPYVGFIVTFSSTCVPAAMKESSRTLYDRFFKLTSASGKAKISSVQPIATSGSTCRSDLGDSDYDESGCPDHEAEAEFTVWTTSSAPEDVLTLRTKKGLCRTFAGGVSTGSSDSGYIQQGADSCGPWSEFSACDGCFDVKGFSTSSKVEQCRTRQALAGSKCKVTSECRPCKNKPCSLTSSRPRSGETRTECFGCNRKNYIDWVAPSGCKCGKDCETKGDCCQSWFYYGCQNKKYNKADYLKGWTPRQCSSSTCQSAEPVIDNEYPSYFCYCSSTCAANNVDLCCDGKTNRDAQCTAAAPGSAPGLAPGGAPGGR